MVGADGRPGTRALTVTASLVPALLVADIEMSYEVPTTKPALSTTDVAELAGLAVATGVVVPDSTATTL